jgi:hypothetical protein
VEKIEVLVERILSAEDANLKPLLEELIALAKTGPQAVAAVLVEQAIKYPSRVIRIIGRLEELCLKESEAFIQSFLLPLENVFTGQEVWAVKAVQSGWKISQDGNVLGLDFATADAAGDKSGKNAYSVNLLLDEDSKIKDIVKFAHTNLTDEWELEILRSLGKTSGREAVSDEISSFPVEIHPKYMQVMAELMTF